VRSSLPHPLSKTSEFDKIFDKGCDEEVKKLRPAAVVQSVQNLTCKFLLVHFGDIVERGLRRYLGYRMGCDSGDLCLQLI